MGLSADPLLIWNYSSVAIIAFVTGIMFWWFFTRPWDKHEEEMNMLKESNFRGQNLGGQQEKQVDDDNESGHRAESASAPAPAAAPAQPAIAEEKEIK